MSVALDLRRRRIVGLRHGVGATVHHCRIISSRISQRGDHKKYCPGHHADIGDVENWPPLKVDEIDDATMKETGIAAKRSIEDIAERSTHDHAKGNCSEAAADRAALPNKNSDKHQSKKPDPCAKSGTEAE